MGLNSNGAVQYMHFTVKIKKNLIHFHHFQTEQAIQTHAFTNRTTTNLPSFMRLQ